MESAATGRLAPSSDPSVTTDRWDLTVCDPKAAQLRGRLQQHRSSENQDGDHGQHEASVQKKQSQRKSTPMWHCELSLTVLLPRSPGLVGDMLRHPPTR